MRGIMTTEEAIAFLRAHSPLPSDAELSQALLDKLGAVVDHFRSQSDARCIGPLLESMGQGTGCGIYLEVHRMLLDYPLRPVVEAIHEALVSPHRSVRVWALQIATDVRNESLAPHFHRMLLAQDRSERFFAAVNLKRIPHAADRTIVEKALSAETESDVAVVMREVVDRIGTVDQ